MKLTPRLAKFAIVQVYYLSSKINLLNRHLIKIPQEYSRLQVSKHWYTKILYFNPMFIIMQFKYLITKPICLYLVLSTDKIKQKTNDAKTNNKSKQN